MIRNHIFAARDCTRAELTAALHVPSGTVREDNGWTWAEVSGWDFRLEELVAQAEALRGPAMVATFCHGGFWMLRLRAEGELPFDACFEFERLLLGPDALEGGAWADDSGMEPEPPSEPLADLAAPDGDFFAPPWSKRASEEEETLEDFLALPARMGAPIPDDVVGELQELPAEQRVDELLGWYADEFLDAFERFQLPHEPNEIDEIITGEAVTDSELETPEGNLPRLLVALGLGGELVDWLSQITLEEEDPLDELGEAQALRADLNHIFRHTEQSTPQPLDGGPVPLPLDELDVLVRLGWFCSHMVGVVVGFTLPAGAALEDYPAALDWTPKGAGARTPVYPGDFFEYADDREAVAEVLRSLPNGAIITVWFGDDAYAVARQCYTGTKEGAHWRIEAAAPAVPSATLASALELARAIQRRTPIRLNNEQEFADALKLSVESGNVDGHFARLSGLEADGAEDERIELAVALFRLRFSSQWDTADVQRDEITDTQGYIQELGSMLSRMMIPFKDTLIFQGDGRRYFPADLDQMDFDGQRDTALESLERSTRQTTARGFQLAGDYFCDTHPAEFYRVYLAPGALAILLERIAQPGLIAKDLVSEFSDGTILLTTTTDMYSLPHRGLLVRVAGDPTLETLLADHEAGLGQLLSTERGPLPISAQPQAVAALLEKLFFKIEGVGQEPLIDSELDRPWVR